MKNTKASERRKVLLIDPGFQKSFLKYTIGTALAVVAVFFFSLRLFFWRLESKGIALGLTSDHVFFQFTREQRWTMDLIFVGTAILVVLILGATGLNMSNRIAGPIYRTRRFLAERKSGRRDAKLAFRKNDYFTDLAHSINDAICDSENVSGSKK